MFYSYRFSKESFMDPSENSISSLTTCSINQNLLLNTTSDIAEKGKNW